MAKLVISDMSRLASFRPQTHQFVASRTIGFGCTALHALWEKQGCATAVLFGSEHSPVKALPASVVEIKII